MATVHQHRAPTVLVVSPDAGLRDHVGAWLENDGWDVEICPGPGPAWHQQCIGLRGRPCPLERASDLVVLDLAPEGQHLVDHSPRPELVELYRARGKPVLVLLDEPWGISTPQVSGVAFGDRMSTREAFLEAIKELASAH